LQIRLFTIIASIVATLVLSGCMPLPPAPDYPGGSGGSTGSSSGGTGGGSQPPGNQNGGSVYNSLPCPWVELDPYYVNGRQAVRINVATIHRMWLERTAVDVTELFMTDINDNRPRTIAGCRGNHCPSFMEDTRRYVDAQIVRTRSTCGYTN